MAGRWPGWVYREGDEPDYRFSFANERTFLAWIRTALALIAAGVALDVVDTSLPETVRAALAVLLVTSGMTAAAAAWARWALAERAMRHSRPLPSLGAGALLALALVMAAVVLIAVSL